MARIEPVIYLDLDGVCTDFVSAGALANGQTPAEVLGKWEREFEGEFRPYVVMGVAREEYWQAIDDAGEAFWIGLQQYPWFTELYQALSDLAQVVFLSSATRAPSSLSGKLKWLQARFGRKFRDYIFTAHKQQLASPSALLVDDYERNVEGFLEAGGSAVLFPQPWNSNHHIEDRLEYALAQAREWYVGLAGGA